jgi:hypothetical protein
MKKSKIQGSGIRVRVWPVLQRAVETGIRLGWQRAHKHTEEPGKDMIQEHIEEAVMAELSEAFIIDEWQEK